MFVNDKSKNKKVNTKVNTSKYKSKDKSKAIFLTLGLCVYFTEYLFSLHVNYKENLKFLVSSTSGHQSQ